MIKFKKNTIRMVAFLFFIPAIFTFFLFRFLNFELVQELNTKSNFGTFSNFIDILIHNQLVLLIILSGIITFKIPTIINLIANGISFGFYYAGLYKYGPKTLYILLHAIPELLAFFIGAFVVFKGISYFKNKRILLIIQLLIAEGCLVLAAWIENYITPIFF